MKLKIISIVIGVVLVATIAVFGNLCRVGEVNLVFTENCTDSEADEIYSVLEIETGASILSVNENDFKRRVLAAFPDRSVSVIDVVRSFPNKVTVYLDLNYPLFAVPLMNGTGYALADRDFQLNKTTDESSLDKSEIVIVRGVTVGNSFNLPVFGIIRDLAKGLRAAGLPDEAIAALLKEISFEGDSIVCTTRTGGTFSIAYLDSDDVAERTEAAYYEYISALN